MHYNRDREVFVGLEELDRDKMQRKACRCYSPARDHPDQNHNLRRPNSTEPDHYNANPQRMGNDLWAPAVP